MRRMHPAGQASPTLAPFASGPFCLIWCLDALTFGAFEKPTPLIDSVAPVRSPSPPLSVIEPGPLRLALTLVKGGTTSKGSPVAELEPADCDAPTTAVTM